MKLSKKMAEVMEDLKGAEYYYTADGEKLTMHFTNKVVGYRAAWMYKDGTLGVLENSSTIKALEKRGLVEIVEMGGSFMDRVILKGAEFHKPLERAIKINVSIKTENGRGKLLEQTYEQYMEIGTPIEVVEKRVKENYPVAQSVTVTPLQVVELEVKQPN